MAELDRADLKNENDTLLPDNLTQSIEPVDHRSVNNDVIDSCLNIAEASLQTVDGLVNFNGGAQSFGYTVAALNKIYYINSVNDFPVEPNLNDEIDLWDGISNSTYIFASNLLDISPYTLINSQGNQQLTGTSVRASRLDSTSVNPLIKLDGGSIRIDQMTLNCPNADVFDINGNGTDSSVAFYNVFIFTCKSVAPDITGTISTLFFRCVILGTTVGGISWSGYNGAAQFVGSNFGLKTGFLGWTGNMIDFKTATFDLIAIGGLCKFYTELGNTAISGAALSANLAPDGRGLISGNLVLGEGTNLTVMDEQDIGFIYSSNVGLTDSMADARVTAIGNALVTDTTAGPAQVNAVFVEQQANKHSTTAAGVITYIDEDDVAGVPIDIFCSVEPNSGTNQTIVMWIAKGNDGTGDLPVTALAIDVSSRQTVRADNNDPQTMATKTQLSEEKGSIFAVFVDNETSGANSVIVSNPKFTIN
jgi:hypothetical protein